MTKQTRIEAQLDYLSDMAQSTNIRHEDGTEFTVKDLQKIIADSLTAIEEIQADEEENIKYLFASDEMNSIKDIARSILDIETFQLEKDVEANFHDLHVTDIRAALVEAYKSGKKAQAQQMFKEFPKEEHPELLLLDGKDLNELGQRLSDVIEIVQLMRDGLNSVPNPRDLSEKSIPTYYMGAYGLLNTSVDHLQTIIDELDDVAYLLFENLN